MWGGPLCIQIKYALIYSSYSWLAAIKEASCLTGLRANGVENVEMVALSHQELRAWVVYCEMVGYAIKEMLICRMSIDWCMPQKLPEGKTNLEYTLWVKHWVPLWLPVVLPIACHTPEIQSYNLIVNAASVGQRSKSFRVSCDRLKW